MKNNFEVVEVEGVKFCIPNDEVGYFLTKEGQETLKERVKWYYN